MLNAKSTLLFRGGTAKIDTGLDAWLWMLGGNVFVDLVLYADESGTHDWKGREPQSQVAVLAGYVAKKESWLRFHREWGKMLKKHQAPYFHFTELSFALRLAKKGATHSQQKNPYNGWNAERCSGFLMDAATIAASGSRIPVCGDVDTCALAASDGMAFTAQEGCIYWFYRSAIKAILAKWPKSQPLLSFTFENVDKGAWRDAIMDVHLRFQRKDSRIKGIGFADKKDPRHYGLQAADLLAGRLRQVARQGLNYEAPMTGPLSELDRVLFSNFGVETYEGLRKARIGR